MMNERCCAAKDAFLWESEVAGPNSHLDQLGNPRISLLYSAEHGSIA